MLKTAFHDGGQSNLQCQEVDSKIDRQHSAFGEKTNDCDAPNEQLNVLTTNPSVHKGPLDLTALLDSLKTQGGTTPGTVDHPSTHGGDGAAPNTARAEALQMLSRQSQQLNSGTVKGTTSLPERQVLNGHQRRKTMHTVQDEHVHSQDHPRARPSIKVASQQHANTNSSAALNEQMLDFEELLLGRLSELQIAADRQLVQLRRAQLRAPRILPAQHPRDPPFSHAMPVNRAATPACAAMSELQQVVEKRLDVLQQTLLRQHTETERLLAQLDNQ